VSRPRARQGILPVQPLFIPRSSSVTAGGAPLLTLFEKWPAGQPAVWDSALLSPLDGARRHCARVHPPVVEIAITQTTCLSQKACVHYTSCCLRSELS